MPKLISADTRYNMYYEGDWYIMVLLPKSGLSGTAYLHIVMEATSGYADYHSHLRVNIATEALPSLPSWYTGDTHYHTMYSDNAVESGAPVFATIRAGTAIGLNWVTITDHSFDLDDVRGGAPSNDKWNALKSEVSYLNNFLGFKLILGEEVSAGNVQNENVHFLAYGLESLDNAIPGDGDDWWDHPDLNLLDGCDTCIPTISLDETISITNNVGGVGYAAHPAGDENWGEG